MRRRGYGGRDRGEGRALIEVRPIDAAQARSIRWPILRAGRPERDAMFTQEDLPDTLHLGAFDDDRLIGVATFFPDGFPDRPAAGHWRLRGMATIAEWRGKGAGTALIEHALILLRERGATLLWCNGRLDALGFYRKLGFRIEGGLIDPHGTGPHHRLVRDLARGA